MSIIGKTYIVTDNSYSLNLSKENESHVSDHALLGGTFYERTVTPVTILTEPFEMKIHNGNSYKMVIVKDDEGDVYTVLFSEHGLTITVEDAEERWQTMDEGFWSHDEMDEYHRSCEEDDMREMNESN